METFLLPILSILLILNLVVLTLLIKKVRTIGGRQKVLRQRVDQIVPFYWSIIQIQRLLPSSLPLPPWNHWALPPDTLHFLLDEIQKTKPSLIVEFGSGISTICIGALIKPYGGKCISIEHDRDYAERQRENVRQANLDDVIEIRVSPIGSEAETPFGHPWYAADTVDNLTDVDLVLVDGPPMSYGAEVRYPGIALMLPRLSATGVIYCDDADRPGEKAIRDYITDHFPNAVLSHIPVGRGCLKIQAKPEN